MEHLYGLRLGALWRSFRAQGFAFWALCAYFLFEYVRPQDIYPAIDVLPWAQLALFLALLASTVDPTVTWRRSVQNTLIIFFVFVILLSSALAFSPALAFANMKIIVNWVLVYFLVVCVINTEKRLLLFLVVFMLYSLKMAQHGAITWAERGFSFASWGLIGAPGWFRNSGEYAIQMLIFSCLSVAVVVALRDYWARYRRAILYSLAALGPMAVLGASSRGAQLALGAVLVWLVIQHSKRFRMTVMAVVVGGAAYMMVPVEQLERFREMGADETSLQRLAYWDLGLNNLVENPVLGVGYSNFRAYWSYSKPEGVGPYQMIEEPHNIFVQVAAELGGLGLLAFLLMIACTFLLNLRTRKAASAQNASFLRCIAYGLDAGLIAFLVAGLFVTVAYYPFLWVQMALSVATHNIARRLPATPLEFSASDPKSVS